MVDSLSSRILITGANGFVGRHLIPHLLGEGAFADAVLFAATHSSGNTPLPQPALAGWDGAAVSGEIETLTLDLSDREGLFREIKRISPTHIVHLAARSSGAALERDAVFEVNVAGTRHLLDAAAEVSPFPKTIVVSTGYVYGNTDALRPAREEDPIGPLWKFGAYTDSKIEMEQVARDYAAFALIARPFAHTGAGHGAQFALPSFARQLSQIERGELPPVLKVGNLDAERDMLAVQDVVCAYSLLLQKGVAGHTYNIATGKPYSMREMLNLLRRACKVETELETDPDRLRPADIALSTGDAQTLRLQTGWTPQHSLEETLESLLDYWRQWRG